MGTGHSGLYSGTKGSMQEQAARVTKTQLIREMKNSGAKLSEQDIVFITRDKTGQVVWLETGSSSAGLEHIQSRHAADFQAKHGVSKGSIPSHLERIISKGKVEYSRIVLKNGKEGYERLYRYKEKYYLLSGIGKNGFIVSGYPIDKTVAEKMIERFSK